MRGKFVASGVLVLILSAVQAVAAAPAQATNPCINADNWASTTAGNSEVFNASIGCDGVWALDARTQSDYILGQFFKDGAWHSSTYGWTWVPHGTNSLKIIGNTVNGRSCRGIAFAHSQNVYEMF